MTGDRDRNLGSQARAPKLARRSVVSDRASSRGGIAADFLKAVDTDPAAVALIEGERRVAYRDLAELSARVAVFLAHRSVAAGDPVLLVAPNTVAWVAGYLGVLRAGGVAVTISADAHGQEIARAAELTGAAIVLAAAQRVSAIDADCCPSGIAVLALETAMRARPGRSDDAIVERGWTDVAAVLFTPGVSGLARGVALTHGNLAAAARDFAGAVCELARDDVVIAALPFSHALGQTVAVNAPLGVGSAVSLIPRFDADGAVRQLERDAATVFAGTPTSYRAVLQAARHADVVRSRLTRGMTSGAALSPALLGDFEEVFECVVLEGYGVSESAAVGAFNRLREPRKPGTVGPPMPGAELRVIDGDGGVLGADHVGEILVRGDYVMAGYVADPDATARVLRDGWLHTGDLGRLDADGHLTVLGRQDEVLAVGDRTVFAKAIEDVLGSHPAVREAAVIALGDDGWGTEIGAAIVLRDAFDIDPGALQRHVHAHLATDDCPRHIWFVDELPRSSTGKILKRELGVPPEAPEAAV
jgi:long-chain acyl-CoA synthetase